MPSTPENAFPGSVKVQSSKSKNCEYIKSVTTYFVALALSVTIPSIVEYTIPTNGMPIHMIITRRPKFLARVCVVAA